MKSIDFGRGRRRADRRQSIVGLIVAAALCAGACTPSADYQDRDVTVLPNGDVVVSALDMSGAGWEDRHRVTNDSGATWTGHASIAADARLTEACLSDGVTCIRLGDGATVLESTDAGSTWKTAWSLDASPLWLNLANGDGLSRNVEVMPFDLAVLADDTVIIAMGDIDPLVRSPAGHWSPTVTELRRLPALALAAIVALMLAVLALATVRGVVVRSGRQGPTASRPHDLVRWAGWAAAVGVFGVAVGLGLWIKQVWLFTIAAVIAVVPLAIPALGASIILLGWAAREVCVVGGSIAFRPSRRGWMASALTVVVAVATYVLWSRAGLITFWVMVVVTAIALLTTVGVASRPRLAIEPSHQAVSNVSVSAARQHSVAFAIWVSLGVMVLAYAAAVVVGWLAIPGAWLLSWITLGILLGRGGAAGGQSDSVQVITPPTGA